MSDLTIADMLAAHDSSVERSTVHVAIYDTQTKVTVPHSYTVPYGPSTVWHTWRDGNDACDCNRGMLAGAEGYDGDGDLCGRGRFLVRVICDGAVLMDEIAAGTR